MTGGRTDVSDSASRRVCAVYARVLNFSDVHGWVHARQDDDDHPPVPVTDEQVEVRGRCDFCSAEPTVSFIVSRPSSMVLRDTDDDSDDPLAVRTADATWACCVVCDRLIRRRRWGQVSKRSLRGLAATSPFGGRVSPAVRSALRELHQAVAENMVGQPVRFDSATRETSHS